jgi:Winged helix DNA-binding domain
MSAMAALSRRSLNRTLLERQFLSMRTGRPALEVVRHLVALQGQEPNAPYIGLWTRIEGFRHEELTTLLSDRVVVRGTVIRGTQHLLAGDDYRWMRPLVQRVLDRGPRQGEFGRETAGLDYAVLADAARQVIAGRTLTRAELGRLLAARFPGRAPGALAWSAQFLLPLVHPPPNGTWGNHGATPFALADEWLAKPIETSPSVAHLVTRYLAAFGPAGVTDITRWSGLTRLREVVEGMGPRLRVLRSESGAELFDLPDGPLADGDVPMPVRFLPSYDNLILGHADRSRVIGDDDRTRVVNGSAMLPTFLVDGFVRGTWSVRGGMMRISPFRALSKADRRSVLDEAGHLFDFVAAGSAVRDIAVV